MRRKRVWKLLAVVICLVGVLAVPGWLAARRIAQRRVIRELAELSGGSVTIENVRLQPHSMRLAGLRFGQETSDSQPWLTAERAVLEFPFWDWLSSPPDIDRIYLQRAHLQLRFDARGRLLTPLPEASEEQLPAPELELADCRLTIIQEDRRLVASGIDLHLSGPLERLHVEGTIAELLNSTWQLEAQREDAAASIAVRAATDRLQIDTTSLAGLPLIPVEPLNEATIRGELRVRIAATVSPTELLAYRVELEPYGMSARLHRGGLQLDRLRGRVIVDDGLMRFEKLSGEVAAGTIVMAAEIDTRGRIWSGQSRWSVAGIEIGRLPADWGLPRDVSGEMAGEATLELAVDDSVWSVAGDGKGTLDALTIRGISIDAASTSVNLTQLRYDSADGETSVEGTLQGQLNVSALDLAAAAEAAGIEFPDQWPIEGNAAVTAELTTPLATVWDRNGYRGKLQVTASDLRVGDWRLLNPTVGAEYDRGTTAITRATAGLIDGGELSVRGRVPLSTRGDLGAQVEIRQATLEHFAKNIGQERYQASGTVAADLHVRVPIASWQELAAWRGEGNALLVDPSVGDRSFTDVSADLELRDGTLAVSQFRSGYRGLSLRGEAALAMVEPFRFTMRFETGERELTSLITEQDPFSLPPEVTASLSLQGALRGQLVSRDWSSTGRLFLKDLTWAPITIPAVQVDWEANPVDVTLQAAEVDLFAGRVAFQARVPLDLEEPSRIKATVEGVDLGVIGRRLSLPVEVVGSASGDITVEDLLSPADRMARASLQSEKAVVGKLPLNGIAAVLDFAGGAGSYRVSGEAANGSWEWTGDVRGEDWLSEAVTVSGQLVGRDMQLAALANGLPPALRDPLGPLDGQLSTEMKLTFQGPDWQLQGEGGVTVREVSWDRQPLVSLARSNISLGASEVQIDQLYASLGRGSVTGDARISLESRGGTVNLTATRIDAERLVAAWPSLAGQVEGSVDAQVRGSLGAVSAGTAHLSVARTRVAGLRVRAPRIPLDWRFSAARGTGRLRLRETTAFLAGGRAKLEGTLGFGRTLDVDASARLDRLQTDALMRAASGSFASTGAGRLSGDLRLSGKRVRSLDDLRGSFSGELRQTQALRFPILESITRVVDSSQYGSAGFDSSAVEIRLARGILHVEELAMANRGMQLMMEGTIARRGRLDLDVAAHLGQVEVQPALQRLLPAAGIAIQPAASIALLSQANELFADRMIYLHIGGTVQRPATRLSPAPLLRQELVRFLLDEATRLPFPGN